MLDMSRQDANAAFARTSFLYGGNAAYLEDLYDRYEADPTAVDAEWQRFFASLGDGGEARTGGHAPSWQRPDWPPRPRDELTAALAGDWAEVAKTVGDKISAKARAKGTEISAAIVQQATRDSVRALMLIRAYRIRGHLHANLDPRGRAPPVDDDELDPRSYGFTDADLDRKTFIDGVL